MPPVNLPVEMISTFSREGAIRPVRFRLEAEDQSLVTVHLSRIEEIQEIFYIGAEALLYVCRAELGGRQRRFELRYTLRSHRWVLYRFLEG